MEQRTETVCEEGNGIIQIQLSPAKKLVELIPGAWLLPELLTHAECEELKSNLDALHADTQYGLSYCKKSCFTNAELAKSLHQKIVDHYKSSQLYHITNNPLNSKAVTIQEEELDQIQPSGGFPLPPSLLINNLRYIVYPAGGFIGPHTDGVRVCPDTGLQTSLTLIIYLQDSETGHTHFLKGDRTNYTEICSVLPQRGTALIFQHHLLHMGDGVGPEGKILFRGDMLA